MTILLFSAVTLFASAAPDGATTDSLDFATEVRPILARRCFACHGNDEETREAGLRLDSFHEATLDRDGFPAVVPGDPEESEVMVRITDEFDPMPPVETGEPLSAEEVDILRRWIESGAEYAPHWAFLAPERPELPAGVEEQAAHPVDSFIHAKHTDLGLTFSNPADDFTLLRRVSLDLTGLPPTPEAARAFAESTDPKKYAAAVQSLLQSPAYAERWAAVWLDLARYADSSGHGSDPLREIWRYRDWVIEAFDANMPFDEFTVQQLAGDLLPEATLDARLATAFHRNTMTNTEGGTDDEEFRVLAVKDRVNTTLQVWMGLTAGCAECHSHKYDPISHVEYYQLFDLFNQTADTDRNDDRPRIQTPTRDQAQELADLNRELASIDGALSLLGVVGGADHTAVSTPFAEATWMPFDPGTLSSDGEIAPVILDDGSVLFPSTDAGVEYSAILVAPLEGEGPAAPTALRLDALSHPSLPGSGPGHSSPSGNFVVTGFSATALSPGASPVRAFAVRIELPGADRILSLAEVQVMDQKGQLVPRAFEEASQSSTAYEGDPLRAIDGQTSGEWSDGSVTHTETSSDPFWEGSLKAPVEVSGIRVWPRTDNDHEARTHGLRVVLLGPDGDVVWRSVLAPAPPGLAHRPESNNEGGGYLDVGPVVGEPLLLTVASVTYEQVEFEARLSVDGRASTTDGWAVGGGTGTSHSAVFALPPLDGPRDIAVAIRQDWGTQHVIGRVSLAVTSSAPIAASQSLEVMGLEEQRSAISDRISALHIPTTPVMEEIPAAERRTTHVLVRGNFLQPGEEVMAGVPAVFPPLPDGVEPNRLALAKWLVSDLNPMTARVTVNRVWARLFGRGIVASEGDFGSQGELPTHLDLLDWLAVEFMESGWDHRALLETIVMSRTYRQASTVGPAARELDPTAQWLSRFPRQRLEAEMVRDTALHAAGLLSSKRFGPSVYPPQPEGLWKAAFNGQRDWPESTGEDRYRRGLYVFLRRTIPYPMLATFDAPSRETCTVQRIPTNTPLQAFVTLNDPVFVEASQALAQRVLLEAGSDDVGEVCRSMLWFALSAPPKPEHVSILTSLYRDALAAFEADPTAAADFGFDSEHDPSLLPSASAAWTLVASAALNLDGALTKE